MSIPGSANPLLLKSAASSQYLVERSLRFSSSDSAFLSRTPASAGNRKTWTWAGWVKRSGLGANGYLLEAGASDTASARFIIRFSSDNTLLVTRGQSADRITSQVFRDVSAWCHLVVAVDTTQATANDRIKIYFNGTQITAFSSTSNPGPNDDLGVNAAAVHAIGRSNVDNGDYFNGYLADVHLIDGQALTPSSFTEVSATTGRLEPKQYAGSFGTNGFWLKFSDNSAATATTLGKDYSGNSNNWNCNNLSIADTYKNAVVFDGSGDSLTAPSGASITGTGDFTIEMWMLPRSFGSGYQVFYANDTSGGVSFGIYSNGTIFFGKSLLSIDGTSSNSVTFGAWNHIALTRTSGTFRIFVNGSQGFSGTPSINYASGVVRLGADGGGGALFFNGLLASLRTIQGTSLYSSNFTPPSAPLAAVAGTTLLACQSSTIIDQSANNFTLTAAGDTHVVRGYVGAAVDGSDSTVDTPSSGSQVDTGLGGQVTGNYCTLNPLDTGTVTLANGNLQATYSNTAYSSTRSTVALSSGKWYWEVTVDSSVVANSIGTAARPVVGIMKAGAPLSTYVGADSNGWGYIFDGLKITNGSSSSYGSPFTGGDVIGVALDLDAGTLTFYKNNVSQGQAYSSLSGTFFPATTGGKFSSGNTDVIFHFNAGQRPFAYTAPSGFKALCDTNLPAPVVAKPSTVMDVKLYTGTGANQTVGGLEFSPDLVWVKSRSNGTTWHILADTVRGANNHLSTNVTQQETSDATGIGFASNGFTLGADVIDSYYGWNLNGNTYVGWAWDAGSSTVTNTQGSISSQVRANASAGFSIVTYTGTGSSGSFGHGLNIAPSMFIIKSRGVEDWFVYHASLGGSPPNYMKLNTTGAAGNSSAIIPSAPSSTVINIGSGSGVGANGVNHVCYAFSPVAGYSSFGSYTGSSDLPFIFTGFRTRWLLIKRTNDTSNWTIIDTQRDIYNVAVNKLFADTSTQENVSNPAGVDATNNRVDILSNGFKHRDTNTWTNGAGSTYIYAAFAESPFQYARAR